MSAAANVEVNFIALAVLLIIYVSVRRDSESLLLGRKIFLGLLGSNAAILFLDSVLWVINSLPGQALRLADVSLTTVYFLLNPVPCVMWGLYAYYLVFKDEWNIRKMALLLIIPACANAVLTIVSLFNGALFYFDAKNVYHRGKFFFVLSLICFFYLVFIMTFILRKQKSIEEKFFIPILAFAIPPFIGGVIQSLYYGASLIWVCTAISILIVFVNTQSNQLYIDYLTGTYNRRYLDFYLRERMKNRHKNRLLAAVMIDLNAFKQINDQCGHTAGDEALIEAGKILKRSISSSGMVSRYGGDEFVAVLEVRDRSQLRAMVDRIFENTRLFNLGQTLPYTICFSMGYDIFEPDSGMTVQQFLERIDALMYAQKKQQKISV